MDSGTTSVELAFVIKNKFKKLTVITNSLNVLDVLSDISAAIFANLNIKTFFLTTCGISLEKGVTSQRVDEILVQKKMIESSEQTILIADSSKIGENSLVKMCGLEEISMIIMDDNVSQEKIDSFVKAGIEIVTTAK